MRIVCISDTHGDHERVTLPEGDVLIHAGDVTAHGSEQDYKAFLSWYSSQPHTYKLFIAGNHDAFLEEDPVGVEQLALDSGVQYLNDSGCVIDGVTFWGSPITPRFYDWSFMRDPGEEIERHWRKIPDDTKVLVTHGPAYGILDQVERDEVTLEHTGCPSLLETIKRISPQFHIFGHIHEGYGQQLQHDVAFVNASSMDKGYRIANSAITLTV